MMVKGSTIKVTYSIKPRMKKRWFLNDVKVYDLLKHTEGEYWSDNSFGNGGGSFEPFNKTETLYTFETFGEAEQFKNELEK